MFWAGGFVAAGLAVVYARPVLAGLFSSDYLPHRYCYLAKPWLVWTNVTTDALIGVAYALIFGSLIWIAVKLRAVPGLKEYLWIFVSFGLFIAACGATHAMEVVTVWWPVYPMSAGVKVLCAAVSVPTALFFARVTPSLAKRVGHYLETLADTEQQRDSALLALGVSEQVVEERKQAAREVAEAYERLNAVLECTSDSVMTIGHNWVLLYGNRKTLESLPDFKIGADYWECFPTVLGTVAEEHLRGAMQERRKVEYENYFELYQQWYRVRLFPSEEGLSIFFANITEEKKLQERLEQEQLMREKRIEALSHMAGGVAHEISNPLAIIHGRASDLLRACESGEVLVGEEVREASDSIVRTSDRAMTILRGLRGFGKDAEKDPKELASIHEIVDECMEMQQARFERHNVMVHVEVEAEIPLLLCRPTQIGQIVTNLLNNGFDAIVDANTEERWMSLTAVTAEGCIQIDVIDSGSGIEDKYKTRLMEPFFTTKEFGQGTGIGLSLSRAIAQDHGGTLALCAESTTKRTCFRLTLPLPQKAAGSTGGEGRRMMEVSH